MPGKFNYEIKLKYPHLLGEDKGVWERFILKYPDRFDTVDYDIHVGSGIETPGEPESKPAEQWQELTRKRIDVVGWKANFPQIIEVKKRVGLPTLGQVLGYDFLYKIEHPTLIVRPPLVLCSRIDKDDIEVLDHFFILYEVV